MTPYEIELNDSPFWVLGSTNQRQEYLEEFTDIPAKDLGVLAVGVFRKKSYIDYAAVGRVKEDNKIKWVRAHEAYEWVDWLAGTVYRQPERRKQLHDTERKLGRFLVKYGWAPDVMLETEPNQNEMDSYIDHVIKKDVIAGMLIFPEDDDDGA